MMTDNKIFWHVNELNGWQTVINEQWALIKNSGLLDNCSEVVICTNGQPWTFQPWINEQKCDKIRAINVHNSANHWEWPTLNYMHHMAKETEENYNILYLHLKGLTRVGNPNVDDWRAFMNWSVIERWADCTSKLNEGYDAVSCNWETEPWPHFSGNFWWARSDYVKRLVDLRHPADSMRMNATQFKRHEAGGPLWRFDYEAWVGSGNPKWFEIAKSFEIGGWHYDRRYPAELYRNQ